MMSSDDDDVEPRLRAVQSYYFVDDDDAPVSFDVLPFQFDAAEEVPSFKKDVYLRGRPTAASRMSTSRWWRGSSASTATRP